MKHKISILVILFLSTNLIAQNAKEAIQNTKQITEGKKNLERDINELKSFKTKLLAFDRSLESKNEFQINDLKRSLLIDMKKEVEQSKVNAVKARREIAQSSSEVRSDRRENNRNRNDSKRGRFDKQDDKKDARRDRANTRDDKRDRRDDIRDFQNQIDRSERLTKILAIITNYNFSFNSNQLNKNETNRNLLNEFISIMKEDIEATKIELNEDIRESREDRRERNDDRNERNEIDSKKRRRNW